MNDELTEFTIGDGARIIQIGTGRTEKDLIDKVRRNILNANVAYFERHFSDLPADCVQSLRFSDPGFARNALRYFDSLNLDNMMVDSNTLQGERRLSNLLAIPGLYERAIYQILPGNPVMSTPSLSDHTLLFWVRFPSEEDFSIGRGFHGLIRDNGVFSYQIETGGFSDQKILDIHQEFILEMMRAYDSIVKGGKVS